MRLSVSLPCDRGAFFVFSLFVCCFLLFASYRWVQVARVLGRDDIVGMLLGLRRYPPG